MGYHFHLFCNLQHLPEHESSTTCTALASDYDTGRVDILKSVSIFLVFYHTLFQAWRVGFEIIRALIAIISLLFCTILCKHCLLYVQVD